MAYLIQTPCGAIQGAACAVPGVAAYKGIRYATAGRWEYPKEVTGWEGVYNATAYGAGCIQEETFLSPEALESSFYYNEFRKGQNLTYSEDCLFLNIWTPEKARPGDNLPVLVYIHGGAFQGGCSNEKPFDDPIWPVKGVIAVTLNYRVGPLGFACFEEAAKEAGHTGNYGLYDQLTALEWIQHNIAAFGGSPSRVTLMGQSAGAMSVQHHCLSPLTNGLFARAVMISGGGGLKRYPVKAMRKRYHFWEDVMERCGCEDLQQLRQVSVDVLYEAWSKAARRNPGVWHQCGPCVDGKFITADPIKLLKKGVEKNIPYMMGSTSQDMMPVRLSRIARHYCADQAREAKRSSFVWLFDRRLPGDKRGAWHSSDLWYWFGTLRNCWRPMEEKDVELARQMVLYLTNFARCGDPNGRPLPMWESGRPTSQRVLRIGQNETYMGRVNSLRLLCSGIWNLITRR